MYVCVRSDFKFPFGSHVRNKYLLAPIICISAYIIQTPPSFNTSLYLKYLLPTCRRLAALTPFAVIGIPFHVQPAISFSLLGCPFEKCSLLYTYPPLNTFFDLNYYSYNCGHSNKIAASSCIHHILLIFLPLSHLIFAQSIADFSLTVTELITG